MTHGTPEQPQYGQQGQGDQGQQGQPGYGQQPPPAPGPGAYGQPQPGYQQPGYEQPGYQQPGYEQPGYGSAPGYGPYPAQNPMQQYGAPGQTTSDERTWGMLAHLGQFAGIVVPFGNIIAPLVIYFVKKNESPFVRHHAAQSFNFAIATSVYALISLVLMLVLIGFLTAFAVIVVWFVYLIMAGVAANKGEWYRYPQFLAWPMLT